VVDAPARNAVISQPLAISGRAQGTWFFEAQFRAELVDPKHNELLGTAILTAQSDWMTTAFVPFKGELFFTMPRSGDLELRFFNDNPSGLAKNQKMFPVPVKFDMSNTMTVKVFFGNPELNPESDCSHVFALTRTVPKTSQVAYTALRELLRGVLPTDATGSYFSSIPVGVGINNMKLSNGTLTADFNDVLEQGSGGSCRVSAIRSQIEQTLKQFPSVKQVVISINGRTEDILQP
jgi:hypothetical protein